MEAGAGCTVLFIKPWRARFKTLIGGPYRSACDLVRRTSVLPTVPTLNLHGVMLRVAVMMFAGLVALVAPASVIGAVQSAPTSSPFTIHTFVQQLGRTTQAATADVTLAQPYSWWSWPGGEFYNDTSENITIDGTTTPGQLYFWSYQFHSQFGDGGYVGLQDASVPSGKKIALFSVWQADAARGTNCNVFSGEDRARPAASTRTTGRPIVRTRCRCASRLPARPAPGTRRR
jgi:hypothetical protein